jgi:hypothetical protein
MSLNKFTDVNQEKKWMKINCAELSTPKLTIKATNGSSINMIPDSVGVVNQVLSSNGDGTVDWKTVTGGSGIQNPVLETIYPATNSIDLGTLAAPFRKLYVQNSTIELVNPTDPLKSGSISVNDGNIDIKSNLSTGNVNLGFGAGVNSGENSTNIGNGTGNDSGDNVVNLGFQAGKEDCKNNSINIGNGAGIQNSGLNSIHIGTLAGSTILGGVNGDSSIAIGQSAGQNNIANNSIILNATGLVLDNLVEDAFIVKPVRDQPSYTKILGYDTSSGEIFSSDEKNTLNPVIIATPQVEKNVETKNDNSNAFVVLQPTIGDTELLGGEIRVNNLDKINNTKILSTGLTHTSIYPFPPFGDTVNTIQLSPEPTFNNFPRLMLKSVFNTIEFRSITDINRFTIQEGSHTYTDLSKTDVWFSEPSEVINGRYGRTTMRIYDGDYDNTQSSLQIQLTDVVNPNILHNLTRTSSRIINSTVSNYQNAFQILLDDVKDADIKSLLTRNALSISSTATTSSQLDSELLTFNKAGNQGLYDVNSLTYYTSGSFAQRVLLDVDKLEYKDPTGLITSNYGRTLSNIINTNDGNRQTASNIEISDEKTPTIKSTLNKNSLTITNGSIANSLSNTQLSMIDSSLNRSLLTRLALQFFEPSSTTIATASLNQSGLEIKDTSLTPEISSLTNGFLNISSPINNCVASLSSTTLGMLDIPSTHGTTVDKDLISMIDTTQNISNLTSTSLKLFLSTDLSIPATLLNQTKLEIKDATNRTTINTTELKVQNTTTAKTCSLLNTGLSGNGIAIIPTAGTDISLTISAGGHILLNGLPSSNAGLPSGALYTHVIGGGHKSVCVV